MSSSRKGTGFLTRRSLMAAAGATVAAATVGGLTVSFASASQEERISLGFYPGWVPYGPEDIDYTAWSHIAHFGIYPLPDGELEYGNLEPEDLQPAVDAAHEAGKKIVLCIGSEGYGDQFNEAATDENRANFVSNIVAMATEHGYDGVDIDWEEDVHDENFTALITELREAIDADGSDLSLSFDAITGLLEPELAASVADQVDWIAMMSYWSDGTDELEAYTSAGIEPSKLLIGVGFDPEDYYDKTPEHVAAKTQLAIDEGASGVLVWSFQHLQDDWDDPRLEPLREYVAGN